jgi:hypothetical protein
MVYRVLSLPFAALMIGACNLFNGRCTYEVRSIQLAGSASQTGTQIARAEASFSEQRGSLEGGSLYWIVTGSTLKGHVLSAALKDAQNPSQVLLELPLAPAERNEIAQGATDTRGGANLGGYYDIFSVGRGIVELQTDLSARPAVVIPLAVTGSENWARPYCS